MVGFKMKRRLRWILWLFSLFCVVLLLLIAINMPDIRQLETVQPWIDANQVLGNATLIFQDFNKSYHIISSKHSDICVGKRVLIMIATSAESSKTRDLIRQSWANKKVVPHDFLVQFFIGTHTNYDKEMDLYVEKHDFNDLIRYDLPDTYENLIFKTHAMFSWQQIFCPNVKYLIKIDDDTVLDLERIRKFIERDVNGVSNEDNSVFCRPYLNASPYRNPFSSWYVSYSTYGESKYPTYCSGGIYMMSSKTVSQILQNTKDKKLIMIEDLFFTGIMTRHLNIPIHPSLTFCNKQNEINGLCKNGNDFQLSAHCDSSRSNIPQIYEKLKQSQCNGSFKKSPFLLLCLFIKLRVIVF